MKYYLTMDGGGTKLNVLCYDENFRQVSRTRGGGVNTTQNTEEMAEKSVRDALSGIPGEIREIEEVHAVFVGNAEMLESVLRERFQIGKIHFLKESEAGLLAAGGVRSGLLAISGTGSDVFHVLPDGETVRVGGWGPILGDQGSGAWIGQQAFRHVVRDVDGWGEHTLITKMITEKYQVTEEPFNLIHVIYKDPAPFKVMASVTPMVSEAAFKGDPVACGILSEAGRLMGLQMNALIRKSPVPSEDRVFLCGGAWKTHPRMGEAFEREVRSEHPEIRVQYPWFEHVLAGAMLHALDSGMSKEEARDLFRNNFPQDVFRKGWEA